MREDRCPICSVSVKPENLVRHLNDIHPRHPDTAKLVERIRATGRAVPAKRASGAPFRIRRWQVAVALGFSILVVAGIVIAPYLAPTYDRDSCIGETWHAHASLRAWILDHWHPIPGNLGVSSTCLRPIHTHSGYDPATGWVTLHLGGPFAKDFTVGDFFHIWGEPFSSTRIFTWSVDGTNRITVFVDTGSGRSVSTAYGAQVLRDGYQIEIRYEP